MECNWLGQVFRPGDFVTKGLEQPLNIRVGVVTEVRDKLVPGRGGQKTIRVVWVVPHYTYNQGVRSFVGYQVDGYSNPNPGSLNQTDGLCLLNDNDIHLELRKFLREVKDRWVQ